MQVTQTQHDRHSLSFSKPLRYSFRNYLQHNECLFEPDHEYTCDAMYVYLNQITNIRWRNECLFEPDHEYTCDATHAYSNQITNIRVTQRMSIWTRSQIYMWRNKCLFESDHEYTCDATNVYLNQTTNIRLMQRMLIWTRSWLYVWHNECLLKPVVEGSLFTCWKNFCDGVLWSGHPVFLARPSWQGFRAPCVLDGKTVQC